MAHSCTSSGAIASAPGPGRWCRTTRRRPSTIGTPPVPRRGAYLIQVWVRGTGSLADVEGFLNSPLFGVDNTSPVEALPIEITPPLPDVGLGTVFRGKARGGNVPLEYRWWYHDGTSWTPIGSYASNPGTVTTLLPPGSTYQLQLWVRRTGSGADVEAFSSTGTVVVQEPTVATTLTGNYSGNLPAGTPLTVRASSTPALGVRVQVLPSLVCDERLDAGAGLEHNGYCTRRRCRPRLATTPSRCTRGARALSWTPQSRSRISSTPSRREVPGHST